MQLTKKIKEDWISALKSGAYIQGTGQLLTKDGGMNKHCCLGVLSCVLGLQINETGQDIVSDKEEDLNYFIFDRLLGNEITGDLFRANDQHPLPDECYSNVIPLIEKLETID